MVKDIVDLDILKDGTEKLGNSSGKENTNKMPTRLLKLICFHLSSTLSHCISGVAYSHAEMDKDFLRPWQLTAEITSDFL